MNQIEKKRMEAEMKLRGLGLRVMIQGKHLVVSDEYNRFFNLQHMSDVISRSIPDVNIVRTHIKHGQFHMDYNLIKRGLSPYTRKETKEITFIF
jgi:hypothetical protein